MRKLNALDHLISEFDASLRTVFVKAPTTERPNPSDAIKISEELTQADAALSARLLRVNHAGEIAAQGLYRAQALTATQDNIRNQMQQSALEENDHLNWCHQRLDELNSHRSYLSPVWYWASFSIGAAAGVVGDKWSLGFVKETEDQVVRHLDKHLTRLPSQDLASIAILQQMKQDEIHHAKVAVQAGAAKLPWLIRKILMPLNAKIMTKTAYWI